MILEGAVNAWAFEAYVEQILAPGLAPGQIVLLDNLSVHKGARVRQLIEARGCELRFLPAYSPDYSPLKKPSPSSRRLCVVPAREHMRR
jgi:transposase